MLLCASYGRDIPVRPISLEPERAASGNVGREDWVVVRLDKEDVIECDKEYCHVRIGAVKI